MLRNDSLDPPPRRAVPHPFAFFAEGCEGCPQKAAWSKLSTHCRST